MTPAEERVSRSGRERGPRADNFAGPRKSISTKTSYLRSSGASTAAPDAQGSIRHFATSTDLAKSADEKAAVERLRAASSYSKWGVSVARTSAAIETDPSRQVARVVPKGAKLKRVGRAILGYEHKLAHLPSASRFARLRLTEIERLIEHRHGSYVDTDDGEAYLLAALPHLLVIPPKRFEQVSDPVRWAESWTPRLFQETKSEWWASIVRDFTQNPRRFLADDMAAMLRVRKAERDKLKLKTIGAIDWKKDQRDAARNEAHRVRQLLNRLKAGATPREESASRTKPWIADGYKSRRTWERHGKQPRDVNSDAVKDSKP